MGSLHASAYLNAMYVSPISDCLSLVSLDFAALLLDSLSPRELSSDQEGTQSKSISIFIHLIHIPFNQSVRISLRAAGRCL